MSNAALVRIATSAAACAAYYYTFFGPNGPRPAVLAGSARSLPPPSSATLQAAAVAVAARSVRSRLWLVLGASAAATALYVLHILRRHGSRSRCHLLAQSRKVPTSAPADAQLLRPPPPLLAPSDLHVLHSGGIACEVAKSLVGAVLTKKPSTNCSVHSMRDFVSWAEQFALTKRGTPLVCIFVVATTENEQPPEDAATCVRYFNQRSHPDDLLAGRLTYAVLGLGDSRLLASSPQMQPRTSAAARAKDCNQVAQRLDQRLCALGAVRCHACGMSDASSSHDSLASWIVSLVDDTLYREPCDK